MKRALCILLALMPISAMAQGILDRFTDPDKGSVVFIEKGYRAMGIAGGYRSFYVGGEDPATGDGYAILSLINIGNGKLQTYNVSPSFSYFVANDLSLGVRLDYTGYQVDTDLKLDLRDVLGSVIDNESTEDANIQIASRHMVSNTWGGSFTARKYLSFFGSRTFGVFAEARLFGSYGRIYSSPIVNYQVDDKGQAVRDEEGNRIYVGDHPNTGKQRISDHYGVGLKIAAGAAIRLRDNSALFVSIPIVGAGYNYTRQFKTNTGNTAKMARFNISRDLDFMAIQVGYTHFIKSKKH